ncbi:MAG: glycosyltransferase, partial [Candidatus Goldbacteria bacterium]|nr:glycosyltransferase [Candidatus Goldiibacteriota bacterium]
MKILYLNHNIKGEGTYFRAFNFAKHIAKLGNDITLLTLSPKRLFSPVSYIEDGIKIIETPKFLDRTRGGWGPLDILYRIFHCVFNKYDLIHTFAHKPNIYFPLLKAKFFHRKTIHFADWDDWWGKGGINSEGRLTPETMIEEFLEEDIVKRADFVTTTSYTLKQRAINLKIKEDKIFHIPSGADIERFKPLPKNKIINLKTKYKINKNKKILGFVGLGQADLGLILDGFSIIRKKRKDVLLLIVGPLEKRLQQKFDTHPFKNDIIITGYVKSNLIPELTAIIDICYLPLKDTPTNRGRNPIKVGDYMAAGKPIIANPVGDIAQIIKNHKIGLTVKYYAEDVAEKTIFLLNRPHLIKKFGF